MKRIALMIIRNLWIVPWYYIKLVYYAKSRKASDQEKFAFLKRIVKSANRGGNVVLECYGQENIPKEDGFLITPNHQGMYDVLAIFDTLGHPFSAVIKKELEKIPVLRVVFRIIGVKLMDREDVRQSMKVILEVIKEVSAGRNYLIFPEGTRSKNGNCVGEFKSGTFKIATKTKCPIVPVALVDSFLPFDTKTISPVTIKICYLEPIFYEEYKEKTTTEIAQMVQERIVNKMQEMIDTCEKPMD